MIYVASDIHGCYDKYRSLLERTSGSGDTLYILGDVIDRGEDGVKILLDIMRRNNVRLLWGNHEYTMFTLLNGRHARKTRMGEGEIDTGLEGWRLFDGGQPTYESFMRLERKAQKELLGFLKKLPLYDCVCAGDNRFVLTHAGLGNFDAARPLKSYTPGELLETRTDYSRVYYTDAYLVSGHTPTELISRRSAGKIYRGNNHIAVDCGAVFGSALGCICLDTFDEYYFS